MNRKRILVGLGIALIIILACGGIALLGGNLLTMLGNHMGM